MEIEKVLKKYKKTKDEEAFNELLVRFEPLIFKLIRTWNLRAKDHEEVAQELRIKFFTILEEFSPRRGVKFFTFVHTCFRNHLKNVLLRKYKPIRESEVLEVDLLIRNPVTDSTGSEIRRREVFVTESFESQLNAKLRSEGIVSKLNGTAKKVAQLILEGYNVNEISKELGVCKAWCGSSLRREKDRWPMLAMKD